ncbi:MAG: CopG family transcriptional regulator [Deltaproteobacteria bacterium]|nr:CopG family transcriptional regulator [Deltaproteobacteria bacterium]
MNQAVKRSTIYLDSDLHQALRFKATATKRSVSALVNQAVREALREDQEDVSAFDERASEPTLSFEELLNDLKAHGRL